MSRALRALLDALLFPAAAFDAARETSRAGTAALVALICLTPTLAGLSFLAHPSAERVLQKRVTARVLASSDTADSAAKLSADERDRVARGLELAKLLVVTAPLAKRLIALLVLAALAFWALRGPVEGVRFVHCLFVVSVAAAPLVLADLSRAGLSLLHGGVDPRLLLRSNLALLLDVDRGSRAAALLTRLDLFRLWSVWLTGRGLQALRGRPAALGPLFWLPVGLYALMALAAAAAA